MAQSYRLPIFQTVRLAWQNVKGSKSSLWGAYGWISLIAILVGTTTGVIDTYHLESFNSLNDVLKVLLPPITALLSFGVLRIGLRIAKGQPFAASMVFYPLKKIRLILKLLGYWLLCFLVLLPFIGLSAFLVILQFPNGSFDLSHHGGLFLALAFIPGFLAAYLMIRIRFGWACILDKEINSWEALQLSWKLTRANFWRLLGLFLVNISILFVSVLPFGIGLLWSVPYCLICYGVAYRKLLEGQG